MTAMDKLRVDIWSDIACPWCYVGKRRLEAAVAQLDCRDAVHVVWRAFELDPSAPRVRSADVGYAERLAKKYGSSVAQAEGMIERMTAVAAQDGLDFRFDRIRPGNTFDAHRLLHFAHEHDPNGPLQDVLKERFLLAYMTEGEPIGEQDVLLRLCCEVGLDEETVRQVLTTDAHARHVRADEAEAAARSITGVPFFVLDGRHAVSGAQPADLLRGALERARREQVASSSTVLAEGAACGPDGCS